MNAVIRVTLILALFAFVVTSSVCARGMSQRSQASAASRAAGMTSRATAGDTPRAQPGNRVAINRQALAAPVRRAAPAPMNRRQSGDSTLNRAARTFINVDARGGGLPATVGGFMARNETDELEARRIRQRWQNVTGYAVNAGRAVQRLGAAVAP